MIHAGWSRGLSLHVTRAVTGASGVPSDAIFKLLNVRLFSYILWYAASSQKNGRLKSTHENTLLKVSFEQKTALPPTKVRLACLLASLSNHLCGMPTNTREEC